MPPKNKNKNPVIHFVSGGVAGLSEALCCHPLDTIKVRMQLYRRAAGSGVKPPGFITTGAGIFRNEGFIALYKGLGAVCIGIVPKMAIRFSSFEYYKTFFTKSDGSISTAATFVSGLAAGVTEAVAVVNPMEVVKIRMQAQSNSATDPTALPKYRNAIQAAYVIGKEEGFKAFYKGVSLTALRQATNQGVNFTVYSKLRVKLQEYHQSDNVPGWQTSGIGLISGGLGPLCNAPIDVIKTRLQKEIGFDPKENSVKRITRIGTKLIQEEGVRAFYKGVTPRIMRVAPGQAVTFTVYEFMQNALGKVSFLNSKKLD
ncbi:Sfc1 protein [Saccharomycopsis crataegensis]|uniref:Sfc1 protein n=1 Tax=Saccharomycopsis crataegensis TaxID=43959 RepID=A0AAV5QT03_9ASCO|nr:Sfc1 protein [Saccharomycopsis crataegensis]